jgi:hypothetical protein
MTTAVGKRARPKPLVRGKTVELAAPTVAELRRARLALEEAKRALTNITRRIDRQLGDAELGTVGGVVAVRREQQKTGGHYVRTNWRDDLRLVPVRLVPGPPPAGPDRRPRPSLRLAGGDMP